MPTEARHGRVPTLIADDKVCFFLLLEIGIFVLKDGRLHLSFTTYTEYTSLGYQWGKQLR